MSASKLSALVLGAALLPGVAAAQNIIDSSELDSLADVEVVTQAGDDVGEVEEALIDTSGNIVALSVEVGGFLGIGERNAVIPIDDLTYQEGDFMTTLSEDEIENLPEWDD